MAATAQIHIPPKLIPVFQGPADVRGAYGGRGSAKTRTFATMAAVRAYIWASTGRTGIVVCARQFMNSLDESSMAEVKAAILELPWLAAHFDIGEKYIRTKNGKVAFAFTGLARNIGSLKSKAKILLCWVDEAEDVTETAWETLIPTIREEDSELWVTWNPRRKKSATHKRFRGPEATNDPLYKVVEMNWRDNPRFPSVLERKRQRDLEQRPDSYQHVWEGAFATAMTGAYYAKQLNAAHAARRFGKVSPDPLLRIRAFIDIGGTGNNADAFAMWIAQFVGKECRVLNYYEAVGQPIDAHLLWLNEHGYTPDKCDIWLPHDGKTHDRVFAVSYESAFQDAGYAVTVVPNQGRGAAISRINAGRRMFPNCWFDEEATSAGIEAVGWYHPKLDEERDVDLGPDHDWASHGADAFGLMGVVYEDTVRPRHKPGSGRGPAANSDGGRRSRWRRGSGAMAA